MADVNLSEVGLNAEAPRDDLFLREAPSPLVMPWCRKDDKPIARS